MRLRSRPLLFARVFADAATARPFLRDLLELRRVAEPVQPPAPSETTPPASLPHAA